VTVVDLFSGAGGWDVAARGFGVDPLGIELDAAACATREAAGMPTLQADVTDLEPRSFGSVTGLIASPPCQTFSMAGKGDGRKALDAVLGLIPFVAAGWPVADSDMRTWLVLQPLRWALELEPEWIALEQVPPVLPIWEAIAAVFRERGYNAVTGLQHAEQFGVPQTRKRAVLIASKNPVSLPAPTHSRYYPRNPGQLDVGVAPWVSMAEALGWGMTERPFFTLATAGGNRGGADEQVGGTGARRALYGERDAGRWPEQHRGKVDEFPELSYDVVSDGVGVGSETTRFDGSTSVRDRCGDDDSEFAGRETGDGYCEVIGHGTDCPCRLQHVKRVLRNSSNANAALRSIDQPAGTLFFGNQMNDVSWYPDEAHRGVQVGVVEKRQAVRLGIDEAAVLQTFPADYPWRGTRTKQFQQVGNAIPPLLAGAVLGQVLPAVRAAAA
jgi:DNA (cytosine-5)-methyltransferase 1